MNVKNLSIGYHRRDATRDVVTSANDWKLCFLEEFADFLESWQKSKKKGLTPDTFLANIQTCRALPELARFLITSCGFRYVLLGNVQSDCIEGRFGWIRQLSGANYYISVRQLIESCNKIKTISLLKFSKIGMKELSAAAFSFQSSNDSSAVIDVLADKIHESLPISQQEPEASDLAVIYYVSGACARSVFRIHRCASCKESLVEEKETVEFESEETAEIKKYFSRNRSRRIAAAT